MSEPAPPAAAEVAPVDPAQALSPEEVDAVLADFRDWLWNLPAHPVPPPEEEGPDLHTLLGQFGALRHEVTLQTRAARGQQEQAAEALNQLGEAFAALRQAQASARDASKTSEEEITRPLLKTLVDLYDILVLGAREGQRIQEALASVVDQLGTLPSEDAEQDGQEPFAAPSSARPWWRRVFGGRASEETAVQEMVEPLRRKLSEERRFRLEQQQRMQASAAKVRDAAEFIGQSIGSLATGYTMSIQRVERALRQHGLEPMPAVGQPFDPECMEVVEATAGSGRPPGEVLEEVRRGYLWNGRVFRYAQVRVAKG